MKDYDKIEFYVPKDSRYGALRAGILRVACYKVYNVFHHKVFYENDTAKLVIDASMIDQTIRLEHVSLPDSAFLYSYHRDLATNSFAAIYLHKSFDVVEECAVIPEKDFRIHEEIKL